MGALACEVCGGNLMKQGGVFVCQGCGCSYSLDDVKAMAGGGAAAAAPAAPAVNDREQKLKNLRELAKRAQDNNDSEAAAKYFGEILMEEPSDWRANFFTTFYAAHNVKIAQLGEAARRVTNCFDSVLKLIEQSEKLPQVAYLEMTMHVILFKKMLMDNALNNLGSTADSISHALNDWMVPSLEMPIILGEKLAEKEPDTAKTLIENARNDAQQLLDVMRGNGVVSSYSMNNVKSRADRALNNINAAKAREEAAKKQKAKDDYWAAHKEEKQRLESEKQRLEEEKNQLNQKSRAIREKAANVPALKEQEELRKQVSQLTSQKNSLGLFKGKEKKELQAKIDDLNSQISKLGAYVTMQQADVQADLGPVNDRIGKINVRLTEINTELTKDR